MTVVHDLVKILHLTVCALLFSFCVDVEGAISEMEHAHQVIDEQLIH